MGKTYNNPDWNNISDKEQGYLVGLFIGDGYSLYEPNRHYRVEFCLNGEADIEIVEYLKELLNRLTINYCTVLDKRSKGIRIVISSSKIMYEYLRQKVKDFHNGSSFNRDFRLGLISGFIDAEGYVVGYKRLISLCQKDGSILNQINKYIALENIKTLPVKEYDNGPGLKIWRMNITVKFKTLPHISQKVKNRL